MNDNFLTHVLKYLTLGFALWLSMILSHVNFNLPSCLILAFIACWIEWMAKVWIIRQMETAARQTIQHLKR